MRTTRFALPLPERMAEVLATDLHVDLGDELCCIKRLTDAMIRCQWSGAEISRYLDEAIDLARVKRAQRAPQGSPYARVAAAAGLFLPLALAWPSRARAEGWDSPALSPSHGALILVVIAAAFVLWLVEELRRAPAVDDAEEHDPEPKRKRLEDVRRELEGQ